MIFYVRDRAEEDDGFMTEPFVDLGGFLSQGIRIRAVPRDDEGDRSAQQFDGAHQRAHAEANVLFETADVEDHGTFGIVRPCDRRREALRINAVGGDGDPRGGKAEIFHEVFPKILADGEGEFAPIGQPSEERGKSEARVIRRDEAEAEPSSEQTAKKCGDPCVCMDDIEFFRADEALEPFFCREQSRGCFPIERESRVRKSAPLQRLGGSTACGGDLYGDPPFREREA